MASVHKEFVVEAPAAAVWAAFRDVGAVHTRLAPGFVTDTRLEGDARVVSFANGLVAREQIVDIDDGGKRLAYSVVGGGPTHHNASFQVIAEGPRRSRIVWITDLLPHELAGQFDTVMEQGCAVMKRTLETTVT
jgi:carbon monoxide dehydrogenase subunit G